MRFGISNGDRINSAGEKPDQDSSNPQARLRRRSLKLVLAGNPVQPIIHAISKPEPMAESTVMQMNKIHEKSLVVNPVLEVHSVNSLHTECGLENRHRSPAGQR